VSWLHDLNVKCSFYSNAGMIWKTALHSFVTSSATEPYWQTAHILTHRYIHKHTDTHTHTHTCKQDDLGQTLMEMDEEDDFDVASHFPDIVDVGAVFYLNALAAVACCLLFACCERGSHHTKKQITFLLRLTLL